MKREQIGGMEFEIVRNLPENGRDWHRIRVKVEDSDDSLSTILSRNNDSEERIANITAPGGFF